MLTPSFSNFSTIKLPVLSPPRVVTRHTFIPKRFAPTALFAAFPPKEYSRFLTGIFSPTESEALCTLDDKECLICFSYGEKIPVKNLEYSLGGNAANNAVGAKRLGIKVGLVTTLGGDSTGNLIVEKLEKEGVNMSYVVQQPTAGTNYSTAINYGGERTIFTYHAPRSYEFPVKLPVADWIYLTSMGESFQPFYNH